MTTLDHETKIEFPPASTAATGGVPSAPHCLNFHNRLIYHCLACGNVIHREPADAIPECCGVRMTPAAAETVFDAELPPAV